MTAIFKNRKFPIILLLSIIVFTISLPAENSGDASGKIVLLKKTLLIDDSSDEFYFRHPGKIDVDQSMNIYVLDSNRILTFDRKGKYIREFIKKGQGPGESKYISNFFISEKRVIVHNNHPAKVIWFDLKGELLKEFRLKKSDWLTFIHYFDNAYFFYNTGKPETKSNASYTDVEINLFKMPAANHEMIDLHSFPVNKYVVKSGSTSASFDVGKFIYALSGERYIVISHSPRYKIKIFDIKTREIIHEFSRDYVKREIPPGLMDRFNRGVAVLNGKRYKKPPLKYFNDVLKLLVFKGKIWVVTSTVDKEKGVLVDVLDIDGKHIDQFYLKPPGQNGLYTFNWYIDGQFLYSIEKSPDDDPLVVKYKIEI